LLFAGKVVLVEGLSEKYALGTIINSYLKKQKPEFKNVDTDSEGVEIVEVGGKNFDPFISLYSSSGLQNKCLSLNDGDLLLPHGTTIQSYDEKYNELNSGNEMVGGNTRLRKNIFTFEIDTFFIPDPSDEKVDNIDYLKLILFRFMKDGDYFKKQGTFNDKIAIIDELKKTIEGKKITTDDVNNFFEKILGYEVSKPTLALYLSSLLKAKLLDDRAELEAWNNDYSPDNGMGIKSVENLPEFIIPRYIKDGLLWLITD